MKIAIFTLGCKVNQADSQSIQELFLAAGYELVAPEETADIYIINTCVVTNVGQQKSRQIIRRFIGRNPQALIVVTGCYPQTAPEEVREIAGVDLIVGNQDRDKLVTLVGAALIAKTPQAAVRNIAEVQGFEELPIGLHGDKTRAFLKIQEGCNQFCSYCIIPYARGRLRSRSLTDIKKQVESLVAQGFKEVVLLGIHLGAYGKELSDGTNLTQAVKTALSVHGLQRLRLGSLECIEVDEELLMLMEQDSRFARQLHLPLQAGTDSVLKAMNRPYTTYEFAALVHRIQSRIPDIAITTDIIVGFPGETEADFTATCELAQQLGLAKIHIFPFSKRQGTPAARMSGQISRTVKKDRAQRLAELDEQLHRSFLEKFVGTRQQVLFEQDKQGEAVGYTGNYIRVYMPGEAKMTNELCQVCAIKLYKDGLLVGPQ